LQLTDSLDVLAHRVTATEAGCRRSEPVNRTLVIGECSDCQSERLSVRRCILQQVNLPFQLSIFVGVDEASPRDLFDLETEEIDLSRAGSLIATHRGEGCVDFGERCPRRTQWCKIDRPENIEGRPLGRSSEQTLVLVLTVQVDESRTELGEIADRSKPTVDISPRPPITRHDTTEQTLHAVDVDESSFDSQLVCAGPNHRRIRTLANEQIDRLDDHRLAGTRLASEHRQALAE
jgi:hypothetical protein